MDWQLSFKTCPFVETPPKHHHHSSVTKQPRLTSKACSVVQWACPISFWTKAGSEERRVSEDFVAAAESPAPTAVRRTLVQTSYILIKEMCQWGWKYVYAQWALNYHKRFKILTISRFARHGQFLYQGGVKGGVIYHHKTPSCIYIGDPFSLSRMIFSRSYYLATKAEYQTDRGLFQRNRSRMRSSM